MVVREHEFNWSFQLLLLYSLEEGVPVSSCEVSVSGRVRAEKGAQVPEHLLSTNPGHPLCALRKVTRCPEGPQPGLREPILASGRCAQGRQIGRSASLTLRHLSAGAESGFRFAV